ncbi:MAG: hypothetical protein BWY57_02619 [Betaproteobacteria bacterium ADurb.Bin341]|nr:MAG: hypothetical protein BWY57_02619 [Betaproteobacteria bacterium ADurb.Bin341]
MDRQLAACGDCVGIHSPAADQLQPVALPVEPEQYRCPEDPLFHQDIQATLLQALFRALGHRQGTQHAQDQPVVENLFEVLFVSVHRFVLQQPVFARQ